MSNVIKILSWNVEHFKTESKAQKVAEIIKSYNPDIFGLYEVEHARVYEFMLEHFPNHTLFITEGQQTQEILVACSNRFEGIKFSQKKEFKSGNPQLRPGAFLTFRYPGGEMYAFLFLHTDSGTTAVDFGNRTEMFEHTFNLKRQLDQMQGKPTRFLALGDFNTMGLQYPRQGKIREFAKTTHELDYIRYESKVKGSGKYKGLIPDLRLLSKPKGTHFSKAFGISDLDHILSSSQLRFKSQENFGTKARHEIRLDGWRRYGDEKKKLTAFAEEISDHCLLYCELLTE